MFASRPQALPSVGIKAFTRINDQQARIVGKVCHNDASRANGDLVLQSLNNVLQGKLVGVPGSFRQLAETQMLTEFTGLISVNKQIIAVDESNMGKFRSLSANMYMDENDDVWSLCKTSTGDLMIRTVGVDDMVALAGDLMESTSSNAFDSDRLVAEACAKTLRAQEGQFVNFVDANNRVRSGFLMCDSVSNEQGEMPGMVGISSIDGGGVEVVHRGAIVDIFEGEIKRPELDDETKINQAVAASRGSMDLNAAIAYYNKVYGHNKAFLDAFIQRLTTHAFSC